MVSAGHRGAEGYGSSVAPVGTVLAVLAVVAAIALFRHASAVRRAWTALVAVLVVSSGFGTQYLMWPTPFLNAGDEHQGLFLTSATGYALAAYLPAFASGDVRLGFLAGLSWLVIAAMAQMLYRAWRETTGGATPDEAGSRPIPAHRKATGRPMRRA
jgi:hypothetical protein